MERARFGTVAQQLSILGTNDRMFADIVSLLRCPRTGQRLSLIEPQLEDDRVRSGWLVSEDEVFRYPITNYVPRFVPASNYASSFGVQWNRFRETQLDSKSGVPISAARFWSSTGWSSADLQNKWVLDVGCGAGRFAEIALGAGARLIAIDYSSAVDACYANLGHHSKFNVLQADIYSLPLAIGMFDFVYSLGVLQHTPDVRGAFAALPIMLAKNGQMCVDVYERTWSTRLRGKYLLRPFTRRMSSRSLFALVERAVPPLLWLSDRMGKVAVSGRLIRRLLPIANYRGVLPLNGEQLVEWGILDTFDMLGPKYDQPQTATTLRNWFLEAGLTDVEVVRKGHLVGNGRKL